MRIAHGSNNLLARALIARARAIQVGRRAHDARLIAIEQPEVGLDTRTKFRAFFPLGVEIEHGNQRKNAAALPSEAPAGGLDVELGGAHVWSRRQCFLFEGIERNVTA